MSGNRFLFLCHSLDIGGLETYLLRFSRWLAANHPTIDLHLDCKSGRFGAYEDDFRQFGVNLHGLPLGYVDPLGHLRFLRFLKERRFDAMCDFGGDFGGLTTLAGRVVNIPVRAVFYRSGRNAYRPSVFKETYQRRLNRLVATSSTAILSNSRQAFEYFFGRRNVVLDDRFRVLPNGIPMPPELLPGELHQLRSELGASLGEKVVLHVGSARWEKNHPTIFELARMAKADSLPAVFCLVGPEVRETWEGHVAETGLDNVRLLGVRRDVDRLLQAADLFLFPSLSEGQPNALLEALVAGVPFVAADIPAIREVLGPDWGGRWLFPPASAQDGYALVRQHLSDDSKSTPHFASLVRETRERFGEKPCFTAFYEILAGQAGVIREQGP